MTEPIRTLLVDDEVLARRRLRRLLGEEPDVEIIGEAPDGREAIAAIQSGHPDLVFLDVQMPVLDGFGVLAALEPDAMPAVIFVTAFDQYAVRAFEVHAVDYLLKPFDGDRLRSAVNRARVQLREEGSATQRRLLDLLASMSAGERGEATERATRAAGRPLDRMMIKSGGRVYFVKASEIDFIEAAGNYVRLHVGTESHLLRETMNAVEAKLDADQFLRIHRSTIVNLDRIREMQPWFSGEYVVIMKDGRQLKLSRGYRDRLEERLGRSL